MTDLTFGSATCTIADERRRWSPLVVKASNGDACWDSAEAAAVWATQHQAKIEAALRQHGTILFRGFPLNSAEDFNTFVSAFKGWEDLSYEKSMSFAVRKRCAGRICTTNEGKSGGLVFHHEQAQTPLWPSRLFFCCQKAALPGDGGQTGLSPSDVMLAQLKEKYPDFVDKCEREGVRYTIYAGPAQDASKGAGRSWKSFFHVQSREECEEVMRAGGWDWEWGVGPLGVEVSADFLKFTTPRLDAVKIAPGTDKKCFFNQLIATTANALEFSKVGNEGGYDPLHDTPTQAAIDACVRFSSGDRIDLAILLDAKKMCEENAFDLQWEDGDVALIDNYLVMHARRLWHGAAASRQVYASLVAEPSCDVARKAGRDLRSKL